MSFLVFTKESCIELFIHQKRQLVKPARYCTSGANIRNDYYCELKHGRKRWTKASAFGVLLPSLISTKTLLLAPKIDAIDQD